MFITEQYKCKLGADGEQCLQYKTVMDAFEKSHKQIPYGAFFFK